MPRARPPPIHPAYRRVIVEHRARLDRLADHYAPAQLKKGQEYLDYWQKAMDVCMHGDGIPACSACGALSIVATGDDPAATSVCAICGRSDTHVSIELPMSTVNLLHLLSCIGVGTRLGLTGTGDASFEKIE